MPEAQLHSFVWNRNLKEASPNHSERQGFIRGPEQLEPETNATTHSVGLSHRLLSSGLSCRASSMELERWHVASSANPSSQFYLQGKTECTASAPFKNSSGKDLEWPALIICASSSAPPSPYFSAGFLDHCLSQEWRDSWKTVTGSPNQTIRLK